MFCSKETYLTCSPKCFPYLFDIVLFSFFPFSLFILFFFGGGGVGGKGISNLLKSYGTGFSRPYTGKHCPRDIKWDITGPQNVLCFYLYHYKYLILASWASLLPALCCVWCVGCRKLACPRLGLLCMLKLLYTCDETASKSERTQERTSWDFLIRRLSLCWLGVKCFLCTISFNLSNHPLSQGLVPHSTGKK